uniref:Uncharacterized protein n=1 Tax=Proschkinia sp. SZCZR1824 TaxID=2588390 RepID=A0A4Y5SE20_9STRA|nr:hypothetical protein [Proschkinia sp. SZCZR1824]
MPKNLKNKSVLKPRRLRSKSFILEYQADICSVFLEKNLKNMLEIKKNKIKCLIINKEYYKNKSIKTLAFIQVNSKSDCLTKKFYFSKKNLEKNNKLSIHVVDHDLAISYLFKNTNFEYSKTVLEYYDSNNTIDVSKLIKTEKKKNKKNSKKQLTNRQINIICVNAPILLTFMLSEESSKGMKHTMVGLRGMLHRFRKGYDLPSDLKNLLDLTVSSVLRKKVKNKEYIDSNYLKKPFIRKKPLL